MVDHKRWDQMTEHEKDEASSVLGVMLALWFFALVMLGFMVWPAGGLWVVGAALAATAPAAVAVFRLVLR